jgi:protein phosphatase
MGKKKDTTTTTNNNNNASNKKQSEEELLRAFEQEQKAAAAAKQKANPKSKAAESTQTLAERKAAYAKQKALENNKSSIESARVFEQRLQQQKLQQLFQQMQMMQSMGSFLQEPKKDIEVEEILEGAGAGVGIKGGAVVCSIQGWRRNMEDAHIMSPDFDKDRKVAGDEDNNVALFSVFDGHSGDKAAKLCKALLPVQFNSIRDEKKSGESLKTVLEKTYTTLDVKMRDKAEDSGCTAVTVAVTPKEIICASVGDSRAVICRAGKAIPLSFDHKPENEAEKARIVAAGGFVENNRTNGELAMSRALGDYRYKKDAKLGQDKQLVIPNPDIISEPRDLENDEFLVVACDGVWDCFENQALVDCVREQFSIEEQFAAASGSPTSKKSILRRVTEAVASKCVAAPHPEVKGRPVTPYGTDNVTLMIVKL